MLKKPLAMLLALVTLLAVFTGCGSSSAPPPVSQPPPVTAPPPAPASKPSTGATAPSTQAAEPKKEELEFVELNMLFVGDAPPDAQVVEDALNKLLKEKINCKVTIRNTTWTNWTQKYEQELVAGTVDLVQTATWMNYGVYASQKAFLELDDLLPKVAPDLYAAVESMLPQMKVGGKIYAVPTYWKEYVPSSCYYREDLRKKYDLPYPDSIEHLEQFLLGIQAKEPERTLLRMIPANPGVGTFSTRYAAVFDMKYDRVGSRYGLMFERSHPTVPIDYWHSQDFIDDCKLLKRWCDQGFWSKSTLSDNVPTAYTVENDLAVAIFGGDGNPYHYTNAVRNVKAAGTNMELGIVIFGEAIDGISVYPAHAGQNATAIAASCKYPERAMMLLDLLMMDEEVHHLIHYGIKGVHYDVVDGVYKLLSNATTPPFKYEGFQSWGIRNTKLMLRDETAMLLQSIIERLEPLAAKEKFPFANIDSGFFEDFSDYAAERTAVMNVCAEYLLPLQSGVVNDVDASVAEFLKKVDAAGLDIAREGFLKQWYAYCKEFGYE